MISFGFIFTQSSHYLLLCKVFSHAMLNREYISLDDNAPEYQIVKNYTIAFLSSGFCCYEYGALL